MKRLKALTTLAVTAGVFGLASPATTQAQSIGNIVEVASEAGSFSTLLAAATAAGLAETLSTGGPFTVFAPTDGAFAKIPEADLQALLANKQALTKVLLYHVVSGEVSAAQVMGLSSAGTLAEQDVAITITSTGSVKVDGATVTATDIQASNGVIHVIDEVILPKM